MSSATCRNDHAVDERRLGPCGDGAAIRDTLDNTVANGLISEPPQVIRIERE